jgi:hypothetical protein
MAIALPRDKASDCSNPTLVLYAYTDGLLLDPVSVEFQIFDISSAEKRAAPVQVYPGSGKQTVTLTDCPTGHRLSKGRFVAEYTPDSSEELGDHSIKWFVTKETGGTEFVYTQEFQVIEDDMPVTGAYVTVDQMRAEGVTETFADDRRVYQAIQLGMRYLESITGRFFEPRYMEFKLNGRGGAMLMLDIPIIAIEEITIDTTFFDLEGSLLDTDLFRIYNRHIESGLYHPDDRDNPKIELFRHAGDVTEESSELLGFNRFQWPEGEQNITLKGVFGYTEQDGSSAGSTPIEIERCVKLLAIRELPKYMDFETRMNFIDRFKLRKVKTREQSIEFVEARARAQTAFYGYFTGDPEIDSILVRHMRPPAVTAA